MNNRRQYTTDLQDKEWEILKVFLTKVHAKGEQRGFMASCDLIKRLAGTSALPQVLCQMATVLSRAGDHYLLRA